MIFHPMMWLCIDCKIVFRAYGRLSVKHAAGCVFMPQERQRLKAAKNDRPGGVSIPVAEDLEKGHEQVDDVWPDPSSCPCLL